ncbi:MAG: ribonuclease Z [Candidatus Omnitrophica bacterium]|nr:ribonuclease Z [Candidatus Omnitrophota bacterium]
MKKAIQITFLGTNGWFDSPTGSTVCAVADTPECVVILDAGYGLHKLDSVIDQQKPVYLFLSHAHLDHTVGLHVLAKFSFARGLTIFTPPALRAAVRRLCAQPLTVPLAQLPFPVELRSVPRRFSLPGGGGIALPLVHSSVCFGYRFELSGRTLAYCTDTGICANAVKLARAADILITECALQLGQDDGGWPHLDPHKAAGLARQAGAKQLMLTHFDAQVYRTTAQRAQAQAQARQVFPQARVARDGLRICV